MALNDSSHDDGLNAIVGAITHISLHSADPGVAGSNELTGGSPAYTRLAPTWASAASSSVDISAALTFDIPPSSTVAYAGYWTAASGGTFKGGAALGTPEDFAAQGQFQLSASQISMSG